MKKKNIKNILNVHARFLALKFSDFRAECPKLLPHNYVSDVHCSSLARCCCLESHSATGSSVSFSLGLYYLLNADFMPAPVQIGSSSPVFHSVTSNTMQNHQVMEFSGLRRRVPSAWVKIPQSCLHVLQRQYIGKSLLPVAEWHFKH